MSTDGWHDAGSSFGPAQRQLLNFEGMVVPLPVAVSAGPSLGDVLRLVGQDTTPANTGNSEGQAMQPLDHPEADLQTIGIVPDRPGPADPAIVAPLVAARTDMVAVRLGSEVLIVAGGCGSDGRPWGLAQELECLDPSSRAFEPSPERLVASRDEAGYVVHGNS
ncbi:MAG TPA: hypothetical protein QGF05_05955, partial [Dehalococcoidia bacterium]|nr:hypothetical protein [Dehalococcoidia bacterium]